MAAGTKRAQHLAVARRRDALALDDDVDEIRRHDQTVSRGLFADGQQRLRGLFGLADAGKTELLDPAIAIGEEDHAPVAEPIRRHDLERHEWLPLLKPQMNADEHRWHCSARYFTERARLRNAISKSHLSLSVFICGLLIPTPPQHATARSPEQEPPPRPAPSRGR